MKHIFEMGSNWAQLILGAWLIVSPWLLGFHSISLAKWNCLLVGLLLVLVNAWTIFGEKHGGENRVLGGKVAEHK